MKKNILKLSLMAATFSFISCGTPTNLLTNSTTTTTPNNTVISNSNSTLSKTGIGSSLLSSVLGTLINATTTFTQEDLVGTWSYKGADCKFESENFLQQAGGEIAASTIENKANDIFSKIGIKENIFGMTFNADGTFSMNFGSRKIPGTYKFDEKNLKLTFVGMLGYRQNQVDLTYSGKNNISILFDADKILNIVTSLGSAMNNSTISAINSLLSSYDGMKLGVELSK